MFKLKAKIYWFYLKENFNETMKSNSRGIIDKLQVGKVIKVLVDS